MNRAGPVVAFDRGVQTDGKKVSDYLNELRTRASSNQSPFLLTEVGWTADSVGR